MCIHSTHTMVDVQGIERPTNDQYAHRNIGLFKHFSHKILVLNCLLIKDLLLLCATNDNFLSLYVPFPHTLNCLKITSISYSH
jgi:hypothetical protein